MSKPKAARTCIVCGRGKDVAAREAEGEKFEACAECFTDRFKLPVAIDRARSRRHVT